MDSEKDSLENIWKVLQDGISLLLTQCDKGLTYQKHMELYTAVYNFCTSSKMNNSSTTNNSLLGADLYQKLSNHLTEHIQSIVNESSSYMGETLLHFYSKQWDMYSLASKMINYIFAYLNRHWVKREVEEKRINKDIFDIYTLALSLWKKNFFDNVQNHLVKEILRLIEKHRNGEAIETVILRNVLKSFVSLGLDENNILEVYHLFEKQFIEETKVYFRLESEKFIAENSFSDYMKKVETRIEEEEHRLHLYLFQETLNPLLKTLEQVFVQKHLDSFIENFQPYLNDNKQEDLSRLYSLVVKIENGLVPIKEKFEIHIRNMGLNSMEKLSEEMKENEDAKLYIQELLNVYLKYYNLSFTAFKNDVGFIVSLDKACREFVNRNKVCKTSTKSPELLAKYCDSILRKNNKTTEEENSDILLNNVMIIFKYIEDKDVFQKFYSKILAKRLVNGTSASEEMEENMISKMKESCGVEYTSKLQKMFNDIRLSRELNEEYLVESDNTLKFDFSSLVLNTGAWPLQPSSTSFNVPSELIVECEKFQKFYQSKHKGRKLNWLYQLAKGEMKTTFVNKSGNKSTFIFQVSTYQMGILLQYNDSTSLTYEELQSSTGLNKNVLDGNLNLLVKAKILSQKENAFELNQEFKSKKTKINLNLPIKSEQTKESEETHKNIEEDRNMIIQAAIVRIMKMRKTLKHVALMQEVIQQLQGRFQPKISVIKKCIEILIEKEYLERVQGEKDTLSYVA